MSRFLDEVDGRLGMSNAQVITEQFLSSVRLWAGSSANFIKSRSAVYHVCLYPMYDVLVTNQNTWTLLIH